MAKVESEAPLDEEADLDVENWHVWSEMLPPAEWAAWDRRAREIAATLTLPDGADLFDRIEAGREAAWRELGCPSPPEVCVDVTPPDDGLTDQERDERRLIDLYIEACGRLRQAINCYRHARYEYRFAHRDRCQAAAAPDPPRTSLDRELDPTEDLHFDDDTVFEVVRDETWVQLDFARVWLCEAKDHLAWRRHWLKARRIPKPRRWRG